SFQDISLSLNNALCQNTTIFSVDNATLDLYCDNNVSMTTLKLEGNSVGNICTLFVSGGRNFALFQKTSQSSLFDSNAYESKYAVDGKILPTCYRGFCSHTNTDDTTPYWIVKFGQEYNIKKCILYNRLDDKEFRLKGFLLEMLDNKSVSQYSYRNVSEPTKLVYTVLNLKGDAIAGVKISQDKFFGGDKVPFVCLNEFEAYGDCLPGFWGLDCKKLCPEPCKSSCHVELGTCNTICNGYSDPPLCSIECISTKWGANCKNSCNASCYNSLCDKFTGLCLFGCMGYQDFPDCSQPCMKSFYGLNCTNNCSVNCVDNTCDSISGNCLACKPGFTGDNCTKACDDFMFGKKCLERCSSMCTDKKCNSTTGKCFSCMPGFLGAFCNQSCGPSLYGQDCQHNCSNLCVDSLCNSTDGSCFNCIEGKFGQFCSEVKANETPLGAIIGPIIGGVALILIIVVAIILLRRRKRHEKPVEQQAQISSGHDVARDSTPLAKGTSFHFVDNNKQNSIHKSSPPLPKAAEAYQNLLPKADSNTSIQVDKLYSFMTTLSSDFLINQFKTLPENSNVTTEVGLQAVNKNKNRFKNICPYDHSRVHLKINSENNEHDYINASYIKGFNNDVKFIASQGPSEHTVKDFIRMLWEQNTEKVVMLTNLIEDGKVKCEKYWPDDDTKAYGDIKVKLISTQTYAEYTIRKLELCKKNQTSHQVTQFHFTSWPDKSVPTASWSLVDFEQRVFTVATSEPIVVHCSAGVGRTGTFIALHNVMQQAEATGNVDFFNTVNNLRKDRMFMVQTAEQYEFLHRAGLAAIVCMGTTVTAAAFMHRLKLLDGKPLSKQTSLNEEFKAICHACEVNQRKFEASEHQENIYQNQENAIIKSKQRFADITADDVYRPRLTCYSTELSDYINAVILPSFSHKDQQIVSQLPMPTTVLDFWRLVTQYNITLIVAFEVDAMASDKTFEKYLPSKKDEVCVCSPFEIKSVYLQEQQLWQEQKLVVSLDKSRSYPTLKPMDKASHSLVHMKCKFKDLKSSKLLSFITETRQRTSPNGRVLYICRNGATYSGLACVLSLLLDRIDHDACITVPLVVGSIKSVRPEVIPTLEQYKILHDIIEKYSQTSNEYTNIKPEQNPNNGSAKKPDEEGNKIYANY
ncbi:receptor-type tyrosine-protein phosphatase T, partial [Biomphalaria pfeifferi]